MQSAKLHKVENYAKCKIMQSAKLHKVQNYARCKIMEGAKLRQNGEIVELEIF